MVDDDVVGKVRLNSLRVRSIGGIKAPESEQSMELSHNPVLCWSVVEAPVTTVTSS
jgi:hypothetical protein